MTTMRAFDELDDVAEFLEELRENGRLQDLDPTIYPANYFVTTVEMHSEYLRWVKEHGSADQWRNRLGTKNFSQRLATLGWERIRSNGIRWTGKYLTPIASIGSLPH